MDTKVFLTEEFEPLCKVTRSSNGRMYPTISYTDNHHATFNKAAANILGNTPKLKFLVSTNYILVLPTGADDVDGYCYRSPNNGRGIPGRAKSSEVTTPTSFTDMKLKPGLYRCYEHRNGVVFDRYNPEVVYTAKRKAKKA